MIINEELNFDLISEYSKPFLHYFVYECLPVPVEEYSKNLKSHINVIDINKLK